MHGLNRLAIRALLPGAVLAALLLAQFIGGSVAGATSATISVDAATFTYRSGGTTHFSSACPTPGSLDDGREFQGTTNFVGGGIASLNLPQGATVSAFRLSARDNDGDINVTAYLLRKRLATSTTLDGFDGYFVMASISSSGSDAHIRTFTDSTIGNALVNNTTFAYFAELLNCADTTDPIGVQVAYSKP